MNTEETENTTETISAKLDPELKRNFRMLARERGESQSSFLREIIEMVVAANHYDRDDFSEGEVVWDTNPENADKRLAIVTENPDHTDKSRKVAYVQTARNTRRIRGDDYVWRFRPTGMPRSELLIDREMIDDNEEGWIQQYPKSVDDLRPIDELRSGDPHA